MTIIIAIDGPAGAGKGTLARHLAETYNLDFLDTGLLYRAVALRLLQSEIHRFDEKLAEEAASSLTMKDLSSPSLREEEIGILASKVAIQAGVRNILLQFQRSFANNPSAGKLGVVLDGRDIGSHVLPNAPCKLFVTASSEVRAKRRYKELHEKGIPSIYKDVLEDIEARDIRDQTRKVSPLCPAEGAFILDTSELSIDEVVEKACSYVDSIYPEAYKRHLRQ